MRVLALSTFPSQAAATRFRLVQFGPELARLDIELDVRPFLDQTAFAKLYDRSAWRSTSRALIVSVLRRLGDLARARSVDVLLLQREAMLFGPPLMEWLASAVGRLPIVLDLDDPTWISYRSPTFGRLGQLLKWPGKTDWLIRRAAVVTCGSREIADHAWRLGAVTRIVPTVVDTDLYVPAPRPPGKQRRPVVGWVGSHSTYPYLASLFPVLESVAEKIPFRLTVVGAGCPVPPVPGVEVDARDWHLDREVADFQSLDIGLYPIAGDAWSAGKSGLKAIEYMAVGLPYVASPIGAAAELGEPGATHLLARSPQEWSRALLRLLGDPFLRQEMGDAGRRHVLERYTVRQTARLLADALRHAARSRGASPINSSLSDASSDGQ